MTRLVKMLISLLIVIIFTLLSSCASEAVNYADNDNIESNESSESQADESSTDYVDSGIVEILFTGEPIRRENLFWPEGRDRDWEEDVRHFAVMALRPHPLLMGFESFSADARRIEGLAAEEYAAFAYNVLLKRTAVKNEIFSDDTQIMTDGLREIIIERTNELIHNIPNLNDIDIRQNIGGFSTWPFSEDFNFLSERVNYLYVIIDGGSYSQSVVVTSNLRQHLDNLIIIGEPTGQPENFFAGDPGFLPNSRVTFQVSNNMRVQSNTEDIALRPDIFIPLTIADIISNSDPVLEYIRER